MVKILPRGKNGDNLSVYPLTSVYILAVDPAFLLLFFKIYKLLFGAVGA